MGARLRQAAASWAAGRCYCWLSQGQTLCCSAPLLVAASMQVVLGDGEQRRSMVYKLALHPCSTLHLLPALQAAGHSLMQAADR